MLVLARASCGSANCPGIWVDPDNGDIYAVGDRLDVGVDRDPSRVTVRLALSIYDDALQALRHAAASVDRPNVADHLPAQLGADSALLCGSAVATPPLGTGVGDSEAAVIIQRLGPDVVRFLARPGRC